jgi:hypothetical protein
MCFSGREQMDTRGMRQRVRTRLKEAICLYFNGCGQTAVLGTCQRARVRGMKIHVHVQPIEDILVCCSGRERTVVLGTNIRAHLLPKAGILRCCSGRERTGVPGMQTRAVLLLVGDIWKCFNGRQKTIAR